MATTSSFTKADIDAAIAAKSSAPSFSKSDIDAAIAQKQTMQQAPQQSQPQQSFINNIASKLQNSPVTAQLSGFNQQLQHDPEHLAKVALASTLNTGQGLYNLLVANPHDIQKINSVLPKSLQMQGASTTDWNDKLNVGKPKAGDEIAAMAPLLSVPEAIPTEGLGALTKLGARGLEGEAYARAQGASPGAGAESAVAAELPNLLMSAVKGRYNIPASLLKGAATAEERAANAKAAGDLPVSIGQITQSPGANKLYENIMAEIPFSGVSGQQKAVAQGVQGAAEDLLKNSSPANESSLDPNEQLKQALMASKNKAQSAKNEQYNKVDELAQQEGHKLELPSFTERAKEVQSVIADSPLLQADPKLKSFMNKIGAYGETATPTANQDLSSALTGARPEIKSPSIRDANVAKNSLYNAGETLSKSAVASDRYMGGVYKELSGKIGNDIRTSIKNTGSPELQQSFQDATQEYRNNYGKYLKKDIFKYLDKKNASDSLAQQIVKPGKANDNYSNINLVQSLLPQEQKNLLPAAYLSKSMDENGNIDVNKMGNILRGLGPRQFNALFGSSGLKSSAQDYQRLMKMSSNARAQMANPKTGARAIPSILGGGAIGLSAHAAPLTSAAIAASVIGGSRAASKIMTSPKIREKLLEAMQRKESGVKSGIKESDLYKQIITKLPRSVAAQQAQQKRGQ